MQAIQKVGPKLDSLEVATAILGKLATMRGFLFGHVDEAELNIVYYVRDKNPNLPLAPGKHRVHVNFSPRLA